MTSVKRPTNSEAPDRRLGPRRRPGRSRGRAAPGSRVGHAARLAAPSAPAASGSSPASSARSSAPDPAPSELDSLRSTRVERRPSVWGPSSTTLAVAAQRRSASSLSRGRDRDQRAGLRAASAQCRSAQWRAWAAQAAAPGRGAPARVDHLQLGAVEVGHQPATSGQRAAQAARGSGSGDAGAARRPVGSQARLQAPSQARPGGRRGAGRHPRRAGRAHPARSS